MARTPKETDFVVTLPTVGDFVFGRRTLGDVLRIRAAYVRQLTECGLDGDASGDAELSGFANIIATLSTLMVKAPNAAWRDIESIDIIDNPQAGDRIIELWNALKEKEDSFRQGAQGAVAA